MTEHNTLDVATNPVAIGYLERGGAVFTELNGFHADGRPYRRSGVTMTDDPTYGFRRNLQLVAMRRMDEAM